MVRKQYFPGNTYKTAQNRCGWLKRRGFVFTLRHIGIVFRSSRLARKGRYDWHEFSRSSIDIFRMLEDSGADFNIKGIDNIRNLKEPVVFVSNHMSTMETQIFPCLIVPFMDVTFVVKDSLVKFPVFGAIMRSRDPVVVSRDNSREDLMVVLKQGSEILAKGTSIIIFPQSTRRTFLKLSEFNSLAVKLAARSRVKIVPIAIKTDYWKKGRLISEMGAIDRTKSKVFIEIGEAMEIKGSGKEEHARIVDFISKRLISWGVEVKE